MRSVPEWIGKTDDTPVPPRVRARVFLAHEGTCHITKRKIRPADLWDIEHVIAICNGGENRETNLAPALRSAHPQKTKRDRKEKSKVDRIRLRHLGIVKPRKIKAWRRFDGSLVMANRDR